MRIEFLSLKWKNFLSYPNDFSEIDLVSHRTNLICGTNGSGKSTILDVLSFALYNKPFRDVNKPELVNEINNRDCLVELVFRVGPRSFLIRRGIRPSVFEVFEDGRLLNPKADAIDYQEFLEKQIVRCSHRSFLQTVILGSGDYIPFLQLTVPQRREVIESLLDLKVFSAMAAAIKQRLAETSVKMSDNLIEKSILEKQIDLIEENRRIQDECNEAVIQKKEEVKSRIQGVIDTALESIETARREANSLNGNEWNLRIVEVSIRKHLDVQNELVAKKRTLDAHVRFIQDNMDCPTCKQSIDEKFRDVTVDAWTSKCQKIEDADLQISRKLVEFEEKLEALSKTEARRQNLLGCIRDQTFHTEEWSGQVRNLDEEIGLIRARMGFAAAGGNLVKEAEEKIANLFKQYNRMEDDKYQQSVALDLLPLIKASIIKKYIPFFNKQILFYLQKFDSPIKFTLNEYFEEAIVHRGRDKLGYGSLSEGEKFRVTVAVLFAWRAVARSRGSVDCNLLFLDEIMDSSLDAEGVDSFMRIVRELDDGTAVYVISHKEDFVDVFERVIEIRRRSNFSRINTRSGQLL